MLVFDVGVDLGTNGAWPNGLFSQNAFLLFHVDLVQHVIERGTSAVPRRALFNSRRRLVGKGAGAPPKTGHQQAITEGVVKSTISKEDSRPSPLTLLAETLDYAHHFFPAAVAIDHFACHTH